MITSDLLVTDNRSRRQQTPQIIQTFDSPGSSQFLQTDFCNGHRLSIGRNISATNNLSVSRSSISRLSAVEERPLSRKEKERRMEVELMGNEIHGVFLYLRAPTKKVKIFWALFVVVIVCIATYTTKTTIREYLAHQTATTYRITQSPRLEFPSVIMCPKNPDAFHINLVEADARKHLSKISNETFRNLVGYALADAGMGNMSPLIDGMNETAHQYYSELLDIWKGNRTSFSFYRDLMEKYGYSCSELFADCKHGAERVPCCDIFTQHYIMLRGRCMRLKSFHQTDPDYQGRLYIGMNQLPSPLLQDDGKQPQVIAYLADPNAEMATFPRYYLTYHGYNYISISLRAIKMLHTTGECWPSDESKGRSACYVRTWLHTRIIEPFNCTPFYMHYRAPWMGICGSGIIARNYDDINNLALNGTKCLPSCQRNDRTYTYFTTNTGPVLQHRLSDTNVHDFRLEIGYKTLEYETYEERMTTTMPGFVSEMGGQFGLFAGVSIMTAVHVIVNMARFVWHQMSGLRGWWSSRRSRQFAQTDFRSVGNRVWIQMGTE